MPEEFTEDQLTVLQSVAEMFGEKKDRDMMRALLDQGATIREITMAYRTQRMMVRTLKAVGGLIVLGGASAAALKGLGFWPGK